MKRLVYILVAISLMVGLVGVISCGGETLTPPSGGTTLPPKEVVNINNFASATEGEIIRFYFLLEDADGRNTPGDGHVKIEIFDDVHNSLYYKEFDVKASEFVDYQFELTGQPIGKAYEWRVPITEIKKGISSYGEYCGRAVLTFITPDGKELSAEDETIAIPAYTEEEVQQMAENEYEKSAVIVNERISKGNFDVTVTRAGFFSPYEWGERKEYFRVDMEVKNIGRESDLFLPSGIVILDGQGNQYEHTYGGTLDIFSEIYPGITKSGCILFEGVPKTVARTKLVFELGYDENFKPYVFTYDIPAVSQ